jgi:hypothetical protein
VDPPYSRLTPTVDGGGGTDFFTVLSVVDSPLQWTFAHSGLHPYSAAGGGSQMAIWTPIVDYRGHFGVRVAAGSSTVAPVVRLSGSAGLRPVVYCSSYSSTIGVRVAAGLSTVAPSYSSTIGVRVVAGLSTVLL